MSLAANPTAVPMTFALAINGSIFRHNESVGAEPFDNIENVAVFLIFNTRLRKIRL